jgi:hypothetical protein
MAKDDVLLREIAALRQLSIDQLRARYVQVFGEETRTRNREFIFKRIAYRLQERKYGGLTERARARAAALAEDAPLRRRGTCTAVAEALATAKVRDPRLPSAGTVLRRTFGGAEHTVTVLADGFEYRGESFKSLSVIARKITGTRWNGFAFFGLLAKEAA